MTKKLLTFLTLLCLSVGVGWATESVYYTLTPASGSNNAYYLNSDIASQAFAIKGANVVFYESFDKSNNFGGRDDTFSGNLGSSMSLTNQSDYADLTWSEISNVYACNKSTRLGTSSKNGSMTSPAVGQAIAEATLSFDLAGWASGDNTLTIKINGGGKFSNNSASKTITATNGSWKSLSETITNLTAASTITFSGKRFFLDEILLEKVPTLDAPTFSLAAGTYDSAQEVTISAESGATIYYTTNGSTPTTNSTEYSSAINVDQSMTIKAIAVKNGITSSVAEAAYVISIPSVAKPTISISGTQDNGKYLLGSTVTITQDDASMIVYTLDGTEPSFANNIGTEYNSTTPIVLSQNNIAQYVDENGNLVVKAVAVDEDENESAVETVTYNIAKVAAPVFSLAEGEYYNGTVLTITFDGKLTYSIGNDDYPASSSPVTITIDGNKEVSAYASQTNYLDSDVKEYTYLLKSVPAPEFTPAAGGVEAGTSVIISCAENQATIYYTTDGSNPTTNGAAYTTALTINEAQTVKAAAKVVVNNVTSWSEVATAAYTMTGNATFVFSTEDGLAALGIKKPERGKGTDIGQYTYYSGIVSLSGTDGATNSRVWNTGGTTLDLRVYSSSSTNSDVGTITISVPDGYLMNSIDFTFNGSGYNGLTNWEGSSQSQKFTVSTQTRISSINVTYVLNDASKAVTSSELKNIAASGIYKITDALTVGYIDETKKVLYVKDDNGATAQTAGTGQIDYVKDQAGLQSGDWDHSNWIAVSTTAANSYNVGNKIKGIIGTVTKAKDGDALSMTIGDAKPIPAEGSFTANTYIPANFTGQQTQLSQGKLSGIDYDKTYFFVIPKVNEYAKVTWAVWDGTQFVVIANSHNIVGGLSMAEGSVEASNLVVDNIYELEGIIKPASEAKSGAPRKVAAGDAGTPAYSLQLTADPSKVLTGITDLTGDKAVSGVKYYNLMGVESDRPFEGVNIVVTRFSDGSSQTVKVMK